MKIETKPFDVAETFESVAEFCAPIAAKRGLQLLIRIDPEMPTRLFGDAKRLKQVLRNLIGNAIKFTKSGQIAINVEAETRTGTGAQMAELKISVTDTGTGLSKINRLLLLRKFRRINLSVTKDEQEPGFGLGLSVSAVIVASMNGEFGVESTPDKGSTFWFSVPLFICDQLACIDNYKQNLAGWRIVVASGNDTYRSILSELAASWGIECAAFNSGKEALIFLKVAEMRHLIIDCIIIDDVSPIDASDEMIARIADRAQTTETPVLRLTEPKAKPLPDQPMMTSMARPVRAGLLRSRLGEIMTTGLEAEQVDQIADKAA